MRALVIANAAVDETYAIEAMPLAGESLVGEFLSRDLGGKGANVATILGRCGVDVTLVAAVGEGERGTFVREALGREPVTLALQTLAGRPTDLSLVYRARDGDNAIVTTVATTRALDVPRTLEVMASFGAGDVLVLQGNLLEATTRELVAAAERLGVAVVSNPSPWMPWQRTLTGRARSVFVNEGEARAATGAADEAAVRTLLERGSRDVVLTRGPRGALLGTRDAAGGGEARHAIRCVPAAPATIVDTTGAGDTFLAVALASAAVRGGVPDGLALEHAARASAITVARHGTVAAFPTVAELARILAGRGSVSGERDDPGSSGGAPRSSRAAVRTADASRDAGKGPSAAMRRPRPDPSVLG